MDSPVGEFKNQKTVVDFEQKGCIFHLGLYGEQKPLSGLSPNLFGGRRPRRNHAIQIWWRSVQGFWVGWGSKFAFSHILWRSSFQHSHYRVRCDFRSPTSKEKKENKREEKWKEKGRGKGGKGKEKINGKKRKNLLLPLLKPRFTTVTAHLLVKLREHSTCVTKNLACDKNRAGLRTEQLSINSGLAASSRTSHM